MKTLSIIFFNLCYICLGIVGLFYVSWSWTILLFWLLFAFGNGTIGHRYFAHKQFTVGKIKHNIFAIWCTLSAYSTVSYWQVQHLHHHRHSDTDKDIHSPKNGLLQSLILWPFNKARIESVFKDRASVVNLHKANSDPIVKITSDYFILINILFLVSLCLITPLFVFYAGIAFVLEHIRLGLINSITHTDNFPGNYRNHETKDRSYNNILLGLISLGFGWHNNHHADPKKLILTERWWELDLEGHLGKLLSKDYK